MQDLADYFTFLSGYSLGGLSKAARRLRLQRKRGRLALHSPDPAYRQKFVRLEQALFDAVEHPGQVRLLFGDEVSIYRQPSLGLRWDQQGAEPQARMTAGRNDCWRIGGALDAVSGKVTWLARSNMRLPSLRSFLRLLREQYPDRGQRLVLVWDNWPVHHHPEVVAEAAKLGIELLWLPTYAPWLNPIEKLWRKLKQTVLHHHRWSGNWPELKHQVTAFLDDYSKGSAELLRYVGLLPSEPAQRASRKRRSRAA